MTTTLQHWQGRITAVTFTSLTGAFGLNLAIGQFIAPLMDSLAWSLAATSTVVAVNTLAWGLFQPLAGRLIVPDRPSSGDGGKCIANGTVLRHACNRDRVLAVLNPVRGCSCCRIRRVQFKCLPQSW